MKIDIKYERKKLKSIENQVQIGKNWQKLQKIDRKYERKYT